MSNVPQMKTFNVRMARELWLYLKKVAAENDTSMNSYILSMLMNLKAKHDKKELTNSDAKV